MNTIHKKMVGIDEQQDSELTKKVSIVIPAYNEEKRLPNTLRKIESYIKKQSFDAEIIVVNDGSTDTTVDIVNSMKNSIDNLELIDIQPNFGKGMAVRIGMINSTGNYILFTDADLSTPIDELTKLIREVDNGYDIAIGSRKMQASNIGTKQPYYRIMMGNIFQKFISLFVSNSFYDTQCGFKLFRKEVVKEIYKYQKINSFAFDIELLFLAEKLGFKISEVPINWNNDERSTVSPIKDSILMAKDIFYIRLLYMTKRNVFKKLYLKRVNN